MRLLVLLILLITPRIALAASKADLSGIAYEQRLGAAIPLHQMFRDESGAALRLIDLIDGKPFVLVLGYFHCPNLCGVVRADLFDALRNSGLTAGRDYSLAALSIDPSESSADAAAAKTSDLRRYPTPGAGRNWHFLTGTADATQAPYPTPWDFMAAPNRIGTSFRIPWESFSPPRKASYRVICSALGTSPTMFGSPWRAPRGAMSRPRRRPCCCSAMILIRPRESSRSPS